MNIAEEGHIANMLPPVDVGGVAKTSDYVSMKNYGHINIIIQTGVVGNDTTVTLYESDDASGSTESAIAFNYYSATTDSDSFSVRTDATASGFATGTTNNRTFIIDVDASELTDGYPFLAVKTTGAASALVSVVGVLSDARYGSEQTTSALS